MLALCRSLSRWTIYLLVALLLLAALLVSLLRAAPALAPVYQDALEELLADAAGRSVQFEGLAVDWRRAGLAVSVERVAIGAETTDGGVQLEQLHFLLNLWQTLRQRRPVLTAIDVSSLDLVAQRTLDGRWQLIGAGAATRPDIGLDWLDQIGDQVQQVRLHDGRLRVQDLRRGYSVQLDDLQLDLQLARGQPPRLAGRARLPDDWGEELDAVLHWQDQGGPLQDRPLSGYLRVPGWRPALLDALFGDLGQSLPANFEGDAQLWVQLAQGIGPLLQPRESTTRQAAFQLELGAGDVRFPRLFRSPLPLQRLAAEGQLQQDGADWALDLRRLQLMTEDGLLDGHALLGQRDGAPLFLDLHARLQGADGNVASTSRYLPVGIMPAGLVEWLERSVLSGTVTQADVDLHGFAPDFPFDQGNGRFEVVAQLQDAELNYWPGWPALRRLDGHLHFYGRSMDIHAERGRIADAEVEDVAARIAVLGRTSLVIDGRVTADGAVYLDFLRGMPLAGEGLGETLAAMELDGRHPLALRLEVPFRGQPLSLDGRIELDDAVFAVPDWDLRAEALSGAVAFTERGILAEDLRGRFHGAPFRLRSHLDEPGRITLETDIRDLPARTLAERFPVLDFLDGATDLQVRAELPDFGGRPDDAPLARLAFRSGLEGVGSALPAPLDKAPNTRLPLRVDFDVDDGIRDINLAIGDRARMLLVLDGTTPDRLSVRFGEGLPRVPTTTGLELTGRIETLDLGAWMREWQARSPADDGPGDGLALRWLDLDVAELRVGDLSLRGLEVFGVRETAGFDVTVSGEDMVGGLLVPQPMTGTDPLTVDLEYLNLRGFAALAASGVEPVAGQENALGSLQPDDLPAAAVRIADLRFDSQPLGALTLDAAVSDGGARYTLQAVRLEGPDHRLDATGYWDTGSGVHWRSELRSEDAGALLAGFGHADAKRGGSGVSHADLRWPGGPAALTMAEMKGELSLSLRDGQLVQVEPGAGRLFGLFSVALIPRRLNLDFGDVFQEGFAYDRLEAELSFDGGIATPETLFMDGPSAHIAVTGPVDLRQRKYDQKVTVTPKASTTLPLVGGLVGGLPGAAAMLLLEQLFRAGVDGVARAEYRITGPWNDPLIERVGRLDTSLPAIEGDADEEPAPRTRRGRIGSQPR